VSRQERNFSKRILSQALRILTTIRPDFAGDTMYFS
jgi:hypothetical protein